jgi:hypothetical protein
VVIWREAAVVLLEADRPEQALEVTHSSSLHSCSQVCELALREDPHDVPSLLSYAEVLAHPRKIALKCSQ